MLRSALILSVALSLQALAVLGTLATTAAISRHLSQQSCRVEAQLAQLDPSYCASR